MDPGEDPLTTAKRELLEETGYTADSYEILTAGHDSPKVDRVIYVFVAKNATRELDPNLDAGEKGSVIEVSFNEFMELITQPNFRDDEVALFFLKAEKDPERFAQIKEMFKP